MSALLEGLSSTLSALVPDLHLLGGTAHGTVVVLVPALAWPVLLYVLAINSSYLVLVALAATDMGRYLRRGGHRGVEDASASPLTQAVSVVVPAHDEEAGVVASVSAMLALRHPRHEVVVVDDGSTDRTFEVLREAFDLVEVPRRLPEDVPVRGAVRSVHVPRGGRTPPTSASTPPATSWSASSTPTPCSTRTRCSPSPGPSPTTRCAWSVPVARSARGPSGRDR